MSSAKEYPERRKCAHKTTFEIKLSAKVRLGNSGRFFIYAAVGSLGHKALQTCKKLVDMVRIIPVLEKDATMNRTLQQLGDVVLGIGQDALERWRRHDFVTVQDLTDRRTETMDFKAIDREITNMLVQRLSCLDVTDRFLTEEGMKDERFNKSGGLRWVSDELDGTSNFATGEPDWAHSVALERDGRIFYSVVYMPARGELLLADVEHSYFLNAFGGNQLFRSERATIFTTKNSMYRLPQQAEVPPLQRIRCYVHPGRKRNFELSPQSPINRLYADVANPGCTFSCATALAKVALGKLDAAVVGFQNYWDFAAGRLIIEKAGGHFAAFPLADDINGSWPDIPLENHDFAQAVAHNAEGKEWQCHIIAAGESDVFEDLCSFMTI